MQLSLSFHSFIINTPLSSQKEYLKKSGNMKGEGETQVHFENFFVWLQTTTTVCRYVSAPPFYFLTSHIFYYHHFGGNIHPPFPLFPGLIASKSRARIWNWSLNKGCFEEVLRKIHGTRKSFSITMINNCHF